MDAIISTYKFLLQKFPALDISKIGVISPYSKQVENIKKRFKELENTEYCKVEVNTVDGFQGREKDIIIFSTVRAPPKEKEPEKEDEKQQSKEVEEENGEKNFVIELKDKTNPSIGFLADSRRMNVSLSRARLVLIVIGNMERLRICKQWRNLVRFSIKKKNAYNFPEPFDNSLGNLEKNPAKYRIDDLPSMEKYAKINKNKTDIKNKNE